MPLPIPFSRRTTAAVSVFACIFIASPTGAQTLTSSVPTITALQLEYSQLINEYPLLIHQDTANNQADLYAAIAKAETTVSNLHDTIQAITATSDNAFVLAGMQEVVAHALASLQAVQSNE